MGGEEVGKVVRVGVEVVFFSIFKGGLVFTFLKYVSVFVYVRVKFKSIIRDWLLFEMKEYFEFVVI